MSHNLPVTNNYADLLRATLWLKLIPPQIIQAWVGIVKNTTNKRVTLLQSVCKVFVIVVTFRECGKHRILELLRIYHRP